jgi:sporulation protein YlmC with PRC-barrel domain
MEIKYTNEIEKLNENIKRLQKIKKLIKIIDSKYKNKLIHISIDCELKLNYLKNKNKIINSRVKINPNIYKNPYGFWLSCGSNWIKWVMSRTHSYCYDDDYFDFEKIYVYEIKINNKDILYINNLDELVSFHRKYAFYEENKGYDINWKKVKKIYDGLIICPYLGFEIWNKINDPTEFHMHTNESEFIKDVLKENIMKYPKFYLEWYRHWETSTGVIWKKKSIEKINLIKI